MDQSAKTFLGTEEQPPYPPTSDEKTLAILSHLLGIFFSFIPPLIIYLIKKDESKYVEEHAKESLNFQITMIIAYIAAGLLIFVFIGFFLLFLLGVYKLVLGIIATVKASENKIYRYPLTIRLIK